MLLFLLHPSMPAQSDAPKVFISYSWKPAQHQQKVIALAERLRSNEVDIILDVWDLREGQDKNQFMERMVTDPDIKRVLVICNKDYKEKADGRRGGVGTESMIMSSEIYAKAEQTKFVPLVFELDDEGQAYVPVFVHSRIYLDFTDEETIEDSYEQLIRNIFDKPTYRKPPLGIRPSYLHDEPTFLATAHRVGAIKRAFLDERKSAPLLVKQYYNAFLNALIEFEPKQGEFTNENFIELTLSRIELMKPLRDDFIFFLETYLEVSISLDIDELEIFFDNLTYYFFPKAIAGFSSTHLHSLQFDYLRFFVYELFLYFTVILLKKEQFSILGSILYHEFIIMREQQEPRIEDFRILNVHNATLNKYQDERFKLNRLSVVADNIKARATAAYTFDDLKQAELLLYHISELSRFEPNASSCALWRPETSAYDTQSLPILARMISKKYFDKIKVLFNVETKEELAQKVKSFENDSFTSMWYRSDYSMKRNIPQLSRLLNFEKMYTVK